jgi:ArsR family transcriptional regulator
MPSHPTRRVYETQAAICRGLAHPVRLEVIHLLGARELAFGDLFAQMDVAKAKLSQHLAVLRQAGIVTARREGTRTFYRLKYPEIDAACDAVGRVLARQLAEAHPHTNALLRVVRGGGRRRATALR